MTWPLLNEQYSGRQIGGKEDDTAAVPLPSSVTPELDHLFVGYANEDSVFARWLTLRLTSEGYKVWCDQVKLLGGESYPKNIRKAIRESTFRFLAVISKYSIDKEMPLSERTLASRVGIARGIDEFIIPLNLDGSKAADLDLITSATTYVPFKENWAPGLAQLLTKLEKIKAPKTRRDGKQAIISWLSAQENFVEKSMETLWSNVVPIRQFPETLQKYDIVSNIPDPLRDNWPFYKQSAASVWAFGPPPRDASVIVRSARRTSKWREEFDVDDIDTFDVVSAILRQSIKNFCIRRGLRISENGKDVYFPSGLIPKDKIVYNRYDRKSVSVKVVGKKTIKTKVGTHEISYYHLAPTFRPILSRFGDPCFQANFRLVWTDSGGVEQPSAAKRRRLRWWNYQWLSRTLAVLSWLSGGNELQDLIEAQDYHLVIAGKPISIKSAYHINEDSLTKGAEEDDESEVIEESDEE